MWSTIRLEIGSKSPKLTKITTGGCKTRRISGILRCDRQHQLLFLLALGILTQFRGGSSQLLTISPHQQLSVTSTWWQTGQRLTTTLKERLQQPRAAAGQNPASHLELMVQLRVIHDLYH